MCGFIPIACGPRVLRPNGWLEIGPKTLSLACYSLGPTSGIAGGLFCAGSSDWGSVTKVGMTRAFGAKCLGITFANLPAFLESRSRLADPQALMAAEAGISGLFDKLLLCRGMRKLSGLSLRLGYTGTPKSGEDIDVLAWNRQNLDYHVLTPAWFVPDMESVVSALKGHCVLENPQNY